MGLEDLDVSTLSDEELEARIAQAQSDDPAPEPGTDEAAAPAEVPADSPPAQDPAPAADPAPQGAPGEEATDRGDLRVALQQERDARRQEREQREQYEALLRDPQRLAQYAAQLGLQIGQTQQHQQEPPDRDLDPAGYAEWLIAQRDERLQRIEQNLTQREEAARLAEIRSIWPDLDQRVSAFDQEAPQLAGYYRPDEKYLLHLGTQLANPEARKALIEAEAKPLAEQMAKQMVAEALAKQKEPLKGPDGLARAGAVNPGAPVPKSPEQMTDAELNEAADLARRQFLK
ncbi:MAG: hypothetical protein ACLGIN_12245 [Candidatus Sericytochromatia bacterium]